MMVISTMSMMMILVIIINIYAHLHICFTCLDPENAWKQGKRSESKELVGGQESGPD